MRSASVVSYKCLYSLCHSSKPMKNPFDHPPGPLPVQEGGKDYIWGTPPDPCHKGASAPLGRGAKPLWTPLFHQPVRLDPGYVFALWIPACTGMTSISTIRQDIYETLH